MAQVFPHSPLYAYVVSYVAASGIAGLNIWAETLQHGILVHCPYHQLCCCRCCYLYCLVLAEGFQRTVITFSAYVTSYAVLSAENSNTISTGCACTIFATGTLSILQYTQYTT